MLPRGHWVCPVSLGSHGCALWDVGVTRMRPGVRPCVQWVHLGSFVSLGCALGVVGFIQGRLG